MNKTKIEWVKNPDGTQGYTWNPITGCLNHINSLCKGGNFPCYAYRLANGRLRDRYLANKNTATQNYDEDSYPFYPRFWESRLADPVKHKKPAGIFVCDMSDLFGIGVPEEWTRRVLDTIDWNKGYDRFYLLTKQPQNLIKFSPFPDNCWVGVTATDKLSYQRAIKHLGNIGAKVHFLSLEPLLSWDDCLPKADGDIMLDHQIDWLIIGACTGTYAEMFSLASRIDGISGLKRIMPLNNKTYTLQPKIEWVEEIVKSADRAGVKVFLKDNLQPLYEAHYPVSVLRQELPSGK